MSHLRIVPSPKVVPIKSRELTEERLVAAVGRVLADSGFAGLTVTAVAREAGVDRKLIYKYFHGLKALVRRFGHSHEFWPPACELLGKDREAIRSLPPHELMAEFFKRYLRALLCRPQTLAIMAWEAVERNDLTRELEEVRVRTALEFFELMDEDPPRDVDLTALVLLMAGAVQFLAVRSRVHKSLGGVDLTSEAGWTRIEAVIEDILRGVLGSGARDASGQDA